MSKAAGTANAAGVSFEMLGAYIATISETTRQDAGSIGTALNSMMARLTQVKQKGFNEEDEYKVNDIAKALGQVGIKLLDTNGEWRRMEDIFDELAGKWDTLNDKSQNYVATVIGGTRQQNAFRILMQNMDRVQELYDGAMDSAGTAEEKMSIWQESFTASQENLAAEWEAFVGRMDITPLLASLNNGIAALLGLVNDALDQGEEKVDAVTKAVQTLDTQILSNGLDYRALLNQSIGALQAGGIFGNDVTLENITKEQMETLLQRMGNVVRQISAMGIPGTQDDLSSMLYDFFAPDDEVQDGLIQSWATWLNDYTKRLDQMDGDFFSGFGDVVAKTMDQSTMAQNFMVYLQDYIDKNGLAGKFAGQTVIPELTDSIVLAMLKNTNSGGDPSKISAATYRELENAANAYSLQYADLLMSALAAGSAREDEAPLLLSDLMDKVDLFNETWGTNLDATALYNQIFVPDTVPIADEMGAAAEELQAKQDEVIAKIKEAQRSQLIDSKKNGGFMEEVTSLFGQVEGINDLYRTGDSGDVTVAKEQARKLSAALVAGLQEGAEDADLWAAIQEEYGELSDLILQLQDGNVATAFADAQSMMAQATETAAKNMTEEEKAAVKAKEALEDWIAKRELASQTQALSDENYQTWVDKIWDYVDSKDMTGLYEWFTGQTESLRDEFLKLYPTLAPVMDMILSGRGNVKWSKDLADAFAELSNNLPTKTQVDNVTKLVDAAKKATTTQRVTREKEHGMKNAKGYLLDAIANSPDAIEAQLRELGNGNVDLVHRVVIDAAELVKAGWEEAGEGIATLFSSTLDQEFADGHFVFNLTPILPNGEVLSPEAFDQYIDDLMNHETFEEALAWDKENSGLLINWLGVEDGDVEYAIQAMEDAAMRMHNLHEALFEPTETEDGGWLKLLDTIIALQEDGMLDALYSEVDGLQALIGEIAKDADDGVIDNEYSLMRLREMLSSTTNAWQEYAKGVAKAYNASVATDAEGAELLTRVSSAIRGNGLDTVELSKEETEYIEKAIDHWDEYIAALVDGSADATAVLKDLDSQIAKLSMSDMIGQNNGIAGSDSWFEHAVSGSNDFFKDLTTATEYADDLYNAWESLALIQSDVKLSTDEATEAYKLITDATGLSAEYLKGPGGLIAAEQALIGQTQDASGTLQVLMTYLQQTGAIDFRNANWQAQLSALANSANGATSAVAQLVQALLNIPKNVDVSLNVSQNGTVGVTGGGLFSAIGNGLKALASKAVAAYKNGTTKVQTNTASSSSRGGGGSRSSESENNNLKSEIEKLVHMMDEIQSIWDHQMSRYEAMRKDFEQDKLLQGVILYYQKESDAIEENNKTLESNIQKLEELIPAQQALVASMATTDEQYEQASSDLEKLQSAHQKYSKALLENKTKIKEYQEQIKEINNKIRSMEIDLRNTILKAIQDREALEESMRDARISMENEVFAAIKKRYERERDLIVDNAKARKDALNEEKSALSEALQKRKEAAEADEKQNELLKLQQKLIRISADPTQQAERLALQKQIKELQDELAWNEAEDEVEAQQDAIDKQIDNLDAYIEYVQDYYEDLFEHPKKLLAEVQEIMSKTDSEILEWMKANSEEWETSSEASREKMLQGWQETLLAMRGEIITYWDEVEWIIEQGDDYIINFLKENSADYREAGKLQAEEYVDEWRQALEELRLAHQNVVDDMQNYAYDAIRLSESSSSSSSSSSGGGGSSSGSTSKKLGGDDDPTLQPNAIAPVVGNVVSGAINAVKGLIDKIKSGISSGTKATSIYGWGNNKEVKNAINTNKNITGVYTSGVGSTALKASAQSLLANAKSKMTFQYHKYASGGETSVSGLHWLDGTAHRPERVLSPEQTELFDMLVADLHEIKRIPMYSSGFSGATINSAGAGTNTFGDIVINVDSLSSDEDYDEMADRVMEVISERMNRGRVVGGIRRS